MDHIILNYQKELQTYSLYLTKNKSDAEDLLHDTYTRIFSKEIDTAQLRNIKSFLMTIMRNIYIDGVRRQKRQFSYHNEKAKTGREQFYNNSESDLDYQDIYNAVKSIRPVWQEPFLRLYEGYDYTEMARQTGINVEKLRMRVFYAKKELKNKLDKDF